MHKIGISKKGKKKVKGLTVALVIGHKKESPGASNKKSKVTEFDFNEPLVKDVACLLEERSVNVSIVYRDTYRDLPAKINKAKPDLIISFHANAFNEIASGTETLYYRGSVKGQEFAEKIQRAMVQEMKLPNRGCKPRSVDDRGGYLLRYTNAPCVILEPFFIDNDDNLERAQVKAPDLAEAIADCIYKAY